MVGVFLVAMGESSLRARIFSPGQPKIIEMQGAGTFTLFLGEEEHLSSTAMMLLSCASLVFPVIDRLLVFLPLPPLHQQSLLVV